MNILKIGDGYADQGLSFLTDHLNLLDCEIIKINEAIKMSGDPDSEGLYDRGEYFIGSGLVAIQRYLTSARCGTGLSQEQAYSVPPFVNATITLAEALNTGANYWKHVEEWFETVFKTENNKLKGYSIKTLENLEKTTEWDDYTCANLLSILGNEEDLELSSLLPGITEWRNNMMKKAMENKKN